MLGLRAMENSDDREEREIDDACAQAFRACCPVASLNAALPWDTLTEEHREAWRAFGDATRELGGTPESRTAHLIALRREMQRQTTDRLRPYLRHRDSCPQAPCSCGLAKLLDT